MKLFVITILPQVYAKTRVNINKIHLSYNTGNFAFEDDDLKCFKNVSTLSYNITKQSHGLEKLWHPSQEK